MDPSIKGFGELFARYSRSRPDATPLREIGLHTRIASSVDARAAASLAALREGGAAWAHEQVMISFVDRADRALHVAEYEGTVIGFGKCSMGGWSGGAASEMPDGWYLTGLVVHPDHRRRGVGLDLTRARVAWLFERTERIHYFASALNAASIALHERVGFREVARGIAVPGVSFTGGVGALYRLDRSG